MNPAPYSGYFTEVLQILQMGKVGFIHCTRVPTFGYRTQSTRVNLHCSGQGATKGVWVDVAFSNISIILQTGK